MTSAIEYPNSLKPMFHFCGAPVDVVVNERGYATFFQTPPGWSVSDFSRPVETCAHCGVGLYQKNVSLRRYPVGKELLYAHSWIGGPARWVRVCLSTHHMHFMYNVRDLETGERFHVDEAALRLPSIPDILARKLGSAAPQPD